MPRSYQHIGKYEKQILELKAQGFTDRKIGETLGFTLKQVHNFMTRYHANQRKINAGQPIHKKGRPCKNTANGLPPSIQKLDKLAQMRYVMACKDRYIKQLEMENELMRDFLSLAEGK